MKKQVLGKGLNSLIPDYVGSSYGKQKSGVHEISIDLIKINANQPRKFFDEDNIVSLSESIKTHGIIQPLIVSFIGGSYLIVAGERRYRAAKYINMEVLPCIVVEKSDRELLEISLIENIQREDLNPIEEAKAFKKLIDDFNMTQELLSNKLSISRTSVTNKLRLLKLPSIVQEYLISNDISEGHAKILLSLKNEQLQIELSNKIIDENLNVRQTEKIVQHIVNPIIKPLIASNQDSYISDIKLKLEDFFGTKVSVNNRKNKGNIKIEYYSDEDLYRILSLINLEYKN